MIDKAVVIHPLGPLNIKALSVQTRFKNQKPRRQEKLGSMLKNSMMKVSMGKRIRLLVVPLHEHSKYLTDTELRFNLKMGDKTV